MIIKKDESLLNFEFWSGAKYTAEHLTYKEFDQIEAILDELYPDGMDETQINDLFWFDADLIAEWLGYKDFEALVKRDQEDDEDEEEDE